MNDLINQSQKLKLQADRILKESRLVEILSLYGEPRITGSYPLDVMVRPDLDVYSLTNKHDTDKLISVVSEFVRDHYFNEILFMDLVNFPGGFWSGYCLRSHVTVEDIKWKIDIWLIESSSYKPYTEEFSELLKSQPEKKEVILKIKNDLREGIKYIKGVSGRKIYDAVLKHNIGTTEEFKEFINKKNEQS